MPHVLPAQDFPVVEDPNGSGAAQKDGLQDSEKGVTVDEINQESEPTISVAVTVDKDLEGDLYLVSWDKVNDPKYPQNWSLVSKWCITLTNSAFTFTTLASSTMVAPALAAIAKDLSITSDTQVQLCLSIFVLGYSFGPLWWAPLSELYGRFVIVQAAMTWFCVWNLVAGFANSEALMIVARLFSGIGGSASLAVSSGINADIWAPSQRGQSLAIAALFPLLGPAIGPILGGYISEYLSWNWIFYILSILGATFQVLAIFCMRETHAPTLLHRRAKALCKSMGDTSYQTDSERSPAQTLPRKLYATLSRPLFFLAFHPIVQLISLFGAYSFGIMYIVLSTYPTLWTTIYHQSAASASLNYISLGIGFILGSQVCGPLSDLIYRRLTRSKAATPEMRTPLMLPGAVLIPIGLLWYGWSGQAHLHWIMPNIGIAVFGIGQQIGTQCTQAYMIEAYGEYAASGMAAVTVLKSLAGFGFPLFGPAMYRALDWGWGNTLMALISVMLGLPMPALLWRYGSILRARARKALPGSK